MVALLPGEHDCRKEHANVLLTGRTKSMLVSVSMVPATTPAMSRPTPTANNFIYVIMDSMELMGIEHRPAKGGRLSSSAVGLHNLQNCRAHRDVPSHGNHKRTSVARVSCFVARYQRSSTSINHEIHPSHSVRR